MKINEMNKREQKAYVNVCYAADWLIGSLENVIADNPEDSEEAKKAIELLNDHIFLIHEIYRRATTELYGYGSMCFDKRTVKRELRDINFCGKEWIMERVEKRVKKLGY